MALAPGHYVRNRTGAPARGAPTGTGTWFAVGVTERGSTSTPVAVRSLADFATHMGGRVNTSSIYDAVDTFFACGGNLAYIGRVVGAGATAASKAFTGAGSAPALTVAAKDPGGWGNDLTAQIAASTGTGFIIVVSHHGVEVERSPELEDPAAAAQWAQSSTYIRITADGTAKPTMAAAAALTGGTDDTAGVTTASWTKALELFRRDLGPGQVSAPGATTAPVQTAVLDHAAATNRVAYLDLPDTATVASLVGAASGLAQTTSGWCGQVFAQWAVVRGAASGVTRTVPYSAVQAGIQARGDVTRPWCDAPAAGDRGILPPFVVGLSQTWTDGQRAALNDAGIVAAINDSGDLKTYGAVGLGTGVWRQHHACRVRMKAEAELADVARHFVFRTIDGQGRTQGEFRDALRGRLMDGHTSGAIYGLTADDAFTVDTSDSINPPESKAAGELHAAVEITISPVGERVLIDLTSYAVA